jgi:hypothetical protein
MRSGSLSPKDVVWGGLEFMELEADPSPEYSLPPSFPQRPRCNRVKAKVHLKKLYIL